MRNFTLLALAIPLLLYLHPAYGKSYNGGMHEILSYNGEPLHPACINQLATSLADQYPINASIDIQGCSESERYSSDFTKDEEGRIQYERSEGNGFTGYQVLTQEDNLYLVKAWDNGGGTLTSIQYLLLRKEDDQLYSIADDGTLTNRPRQRLTLLGEFTPNQEQEEKMTPEELLKALKGNLN